MAAFINALGSQRKAEQDFVAEALKSETAPKGWPAALVMFHIAMWRERLRNALADLAEDRPFAPPPENIDELNDAELVGGIGTPLTDAAGRADLLMGEMIDLYGRLGERPMAWFTAKTSTEAMLRNSYIHPRVHVSAYLKENGFAEHSASSGMTRSPTWRRLRRHHSSWAESSTTPPGPRRRAAMWTRRSTFWNGRWRCAQT